MSLYQLGKSFAGREIDQLDDDVVTNRFVRAVLRMTRQGRVRASAGADEGGDEGDGGSGTQEQKALPVSEMLDWMKHVLCGGRTIDELQEQLAQVYPQRSRCYTTWDSFHTAYRCMDCGNTESSCICVDCFNHSQHEGHKFILYHSSIGGCCDCGDSSSWSPSGHCSRHQQTNDSASNPLELDTAFSRRARIVFAALLDFMFWRPSCAASPPETMDSERARTTIAVAKFLQSVCRWRDIVRSLLCSALTEELQKRLIEEIMVSSTALRQMQSKKDVSTVLSALCLELLLDSQFKHRFSSVFLPFYLKNVRKMRVSDMCKIAVQMFTIKSIAEELCQQHNFASRLVEALQETLIGSCSDEVIDTNSDVIVQGVYRPIVEDLLFVFSKLSLCDLIQPKEELSLVQELISVCGFCQGMDAHTRIPETAAHELFSNEHWDRAFLLELDFLSLFSVLLKQKSLPHRPVLAVQVAEVTTNALLAHMQLSQRADPASTDQFSLHIPLLRILSLSLLYPGAPSFSSLIARLTMSERESLMLYLAKNLFRVSAFVSEVSAGLWARNGDSVRGPCALYCSSFWHQYSLDLDVCLMQQLARCLQPDQLMRCVLQQFSWKCIAHQRGQYFFAIAESMLRLIIALCSSSSRLTIPLEHEVEREIAHCLFVKDLSYSMLVQKVSTRVSENPIFKVALAKVSEYREPTRHRSGLYRLRSSAWKLFDRNFLHYSRADRAQAELRHEKAVETGVATMLPASTHALSNPPLLSTRLVLATVFQVLSKARVVIESSNIDASTMDRVSGAVFCALDLIDIIFNCVTMPLQPPDVDDNDNDELIQLALSLPDCTSLQQLMSFSRRSGVVGSAIDDLRSLSQHKAVRNAVNRTLALFTEASDHSREKQQQLSRRQAAKKRQEKLLQQFAAKRANFASVASEARGNGSSSTPQHASAISSSLEQFCCAICGLDDEAMPLGLVVLVLSSTKLRHVSTSAFSESCSRGRTSLLMPSDRGAAAQMLQSGVAMYACGHRLHQHCFATLLGSRKVFSCPFCRRICNALLPAPKMDNQVAIFDQQQMPPLLQKLQSVPAKLLPDDEALLQFPQLHAMPSVDECDNMDVFLLRMCSYNFALAEVSARLPRSEWLSSAQGTAEKSISALLRSSTESTALLFLLNHMVQHQRDTYSSQTKCGNQQERLKRLQELDEAMQLSCASAMKTDAFFLIITVLGELLASEVDAVSRRQLLQCVRKLYIYEMGKSLAFYGARSKKNRRRMLLFAAELQNDDSIFAAYASQLQVEYEWEEEEDLFSVLMAPLAPYEVGDPVDDGEPANFIRSHTLPFLRRTLLLLRCLWPEWSFDFRATFCSEMDPQHAEFNEMVQHFDLPDILSISTADIDSSTLMINDIRTREMSMSNSNELTLVQLPSMFHRLYTDVMCSKTSLSIQCWWCGRQNAEPSICLVCGEIIFLPIFCCENCDPPTPFLHSHVEICGSDEGIVMSLKQCVVLMVTLERIVAWGSLYLDEHGEEDVGLKRGFALYLNEARYSELTRIWSKSCLAHGTGTVSWDALIGGDENRDAHTEDEHR